MSKKTFAILIMLFSLLTGIIFTVTVATLISNERFSESWLGSAIFGLLLIMFLSFLGFRYGKKLYKLKPELPFDAAEEIPTDFSVIARVKIEKSEFIKLSYILNYRHPVNIWITIAGVLMLFNVTSLSPQQMENSSLPYLPIIVILYTLIFTPITVWFSANKNLKNSALLKENVTYHFSSEIFHVTGETFESKMQWSMIKSVMELKHWYILYLAKNRGYYIPKYAFETAVDESQFRQIIQSKNDIKKKMQQ